MNVINNFEIIKELGKGGMGTVYLARDLMLGRLVAIKMLNPDMLHRNDVIDRFKAEAMTLATLNHRNIATLFNLFELDGKFFMVMEYVDGASFEELLKEKKTIDQDEVIKLALQGFKGLHHAHEKKVIHRDLKPGNFMLSKDGVVKVMDFGIARVLGSSRMTQVGNMVGTLEYMAPEQIKGEEGDERSDVYAMGIILFEMLTGNVPFSTKSDYDLMTMKLKNTAPSLRSVASSFDQGLEKIISKALALSPGKRFQNVQKFEQALEKYASQSSAVGITKKANPLAAIDFKNILAKVPIQLPSFENALSQIGSKLSIKHVVAGLILIFVLFGAYKWRQSRLVKPQSEINSGGIEPGNNARNEEGGNGNIIAINESANDKVPKLPIGSDILDNIKEDQGTSSPVKKPEKTKRKTPTNRKPVKKAVDKPEVGDVIEENDSEVKETVAKKTRRVLLNRGTSITLTLDKELSSNNTSLRGKMLTFHVTKPVTKNGLIVIPAGSFAIGRVLAVRPHTGRKKSVLEFRILNVEAAGEKLRIKNAVYEKIGYSGGSVSYEKGQTFEVVTDADYHLVLEE